MRLMFVLCVAGLAAGATAGPAGLPLQFEENRGQVDGQVRYLARCPGYQLFLKPDEAVLGLPGAPAPLRLSFVGAARNPAVVGLDRLPGIVSYFIGDDPEEWVTGAPTFAMVELVELYPGIDLVWRGAPGGALEFDLRLAPGIDPSIIEMRVDGACDAQLTDEGALALEVEGGRVVLGAPRVFAGRDSVESSLGLLPGAAPCTWSVTFDIAQHDLTRPLLIDPVVTYSTYLGGSGDEIGLRLAVDAQGNSIIVGRTSSLNFPVVGGAQPTLGGVEDGFVCKLDPTGQTLLYSTFLGGSDQDLVISVDLDSAGGAVVVGLTLSANFPTVSPFQAARSGSSDCFVARLDPTGSSLLYSTYFGGTGPDIGKGVAVDAADRIYVGGDTESIDLPLANPVQVAQPGAPSAFMMCLDAAGAALVYSTYLGGSNYEASFDVAVTPAGNAHIVGQTNSPNFPLLNPIRSTIGDGSDAMVARFSPTGALEYSTYLGGAVPTIVGGTAQERANSVAIDDLGNAIVVGITTSSDFPTLNPLQSSHAGGGEEAFVTKLTSMGAMVYSTYFGGVAGERAVEVDVDTQGDAWVCGFTSSTDFPLQNPLQSSYSGGRDGFVFELSADGSTLSFSTFIGGSAEDYLPALGLDADDNVTLSGLTQSIDFPVVAPLQPTHAGSVYDAIVLRIDQGIHVRAISPSQDPIAPGQVGLQIQMDVENTSTNVSQVDTITLIFRDAMGAARDIDYVVTPAPGNPTTIAGGAIEVFDFSVDVTVAAQLGTITIDGSIGVTDTVSGEIRVDPAASVPGSWDVVGALPFVRTVDATPTTVVREGIGYAVTVNVENVGQDSIDVTSLVLSFTGTVDRTADYSVSPDPGNPAQILAGQMGVFLFTVDVAFGAALEFVTIDAAFDGVNAVSMMAVADPGADTTDAWTVLGTAYIRTVDAVPSIVLQGSSGHPVSVTVENVGDDTVDVVSLTLVFTGSADRTPEYTVTPNPTNPTSIAAGATAIFDLAVDLASPATLELVTIDSQFAGVDAVSMASILDADADVTDSWFVVGCISGICGDCNGDGVLNILDSLAAALHAASISTLVGSSFSNCNVTGLLEPAPGATVDVLDSLLLAQAAAGLSVTLSCC